MRIRIFTSLMLAGMLSLSSCVNDGDIDDLQSQIDELNSTVQNLKQSQQADLLAAIANLTSDLSALDNKIQSDLDNLQTNLGSLGADYDGLLADLSALQQEVASGVNVYYGNVITANDYAAFKAQGATIITGRVVVSSNAHVQALAAVELIGNNLDIIGGTTITFPALRAVGENLKVSGLSESATINLSKVASIGGGVKIMNNAALTQFVANEVLLIGGELSSVNNSTLTNLSFSKLGQVAEVNVQEGIPAQFGGFSTGVLDVLNLGGANVIGNVNVSHAGDVNMLSVGSVGGNFLLEYTYVNNISIAGKSIKGDFTIQYNNKLQTISAPNLERIEGNLNISGNVGDTFLGFTSLTALPSFPALEYIGGNFTVEGNSDLTSATGFNAVEEIVGTSIRFAGNGNLESVDILNALTKVYHNWNYASVYVSAKTNWFNGFSEVIQLKDVNVTISLPSDDGGFGISSTNSTAATGNILFEGFGKLSQSSTLQLYTKDVTEFKAFGLYENIIWGWSDYQLVFEMPAVGVGMCSMKTFLNKLKTGGTLSNKVVRFNDNVWVEESWGGYFMTVNVDRDTAVNRLLAPCL